ncbi:Fpg/Nei family DNA glycosylase [Patulibacter americanus]|uniref:Fpg/Nei family DNA glycosylase n=1 Tax=Patulibacter americanus TaxID=588672 RepID=UPI0003B4C3C3|nr:DNA-formamidopyrimidine glycosylase family protein [Patulibacter americanus]
MPELPEVEAARALAERWTVGRTIVGVDDGDEWVNRPHPPGEIAAAITGRKVLEVGRIGKSMWMDLDGPDAPRLGLHLGMAGRLVGLGPEGVGGATAVGPADGLYFKGIDVLDEDDGLFGSAGEPLTAAERAAWSMPVRSGQRQLPGDGSWSRFALDLDDGGRLILFDKRRLGRVRLNPDLSSLGPDALLITEDEFVARVGKGAAPLKARLMDQATIAGVGNLLCDELLWQAAQPPLRPANDLAEDELRELHATMVASTREAIHRGGVHLGDVIAYRKKGEHCPRCGAEMVKAAVGGRTTWWCSREQAWPESG